MLSIHHVVVDVIVLCLRSSLIDKRVTEMKASDWLSLKSTFGF